MTQPQAAGAQPATARAARPSIPAPAAAARATRPHPLTLPDAALLTEPQVREVVPFGRTTLHQMIEAGDFPAPMRKPGTRVRLWRVGTVRKWLEETFVEEAAPRGA